MLAKGSVNVKSRFFSRSAYLSDKYEILANASTEKPADWDKAKPYRAIPGPKPAPFIGNIWRFFIGEYATEIEHVPKKLHEKYGNIVLFGDIGEMADFLYVFDVKDIEKCYRNEGLWPIREGFQSLAKYRNVVRKDIFGNAGSLLTVHGKEWQKFRSTVNPVLMQPRTVDQYIASMNSVSEDLVKRMHVFGAANSLGEMPANFNNELNKWAFESIGLVALDRRLGCLDENSNPEAEQMVDYMIELFKLMQQLDYTPMGKYLMKFNMKIWRTFVAKQDFFTEITLKYLNEAIERIKNTAEYRNKPENEKGAFEKLLEKDKTIAMITTLDLLSAGIDTTGKTSGAALYFLAKNQKVQNTLRKELMKALPDKNTVLTKEILSNLPYLKAVIKETTRLAPIGTANARMTTTPIVMSGYRVPPGVNVIFPNMYLSRQEKHYKRPTEFLPERWFRTGELSYKHVNPFVALPFGFGPRSCIGKRLALMEMEILVSKVIRNFTLEWPHADMTFAQEMSYGFKDPLKLHVKPV